MPVSPSRTATVEQRWYAHRVNKTLLVMEVEVIAVQVQVQGPSDEAGQQDADPGGSVTVGLALHTVGNESDGVFTGDIAWSASACPTAIAAATRFSGPSRPHLPQTR